jgi:hypothetical protein
LQPDEYGFSLILLFYYSAPVVQKSNRDNIL